MDNSQIAQGHPSAGSAPAGDVPTPAPRTRRGPIQPANKLDRRIVRVWRIHEGIALVILALVAAGIVAGMYLGGAFAANFAIALGTCIVVAICVIAQFISFAVVPPIRYSRWRYEVTTTDVVLKHGIIVVKTVVVPLVRVQHVETKQGPILKSCGLSSVTISTAGDSFEIPGLGSSEAERLRDQVAVLARIAQEDV